MTRIVIGTWVMLLILYLIALTMVVLETPDVWISHTTGECVKVLPESAGSCDELPERYNKVWVK